ncbi:hypothetical protein CGI42_27000, partial [Vibrio parahaemolyticus]
TTIVFGYPLGTVSSYPLKNDFVCSNVIPKLTPNGRGIDFTSVDKALEESRIESKQIVFFIFIIILI